MVEHDSGLWVPNEATAHVENPPDRVIVDNRTDLPDGEVFRAVDTYFEQTAGMLFSGQTAYQSYGAEGSMMTRTKFRAPSNVIEEIKIARDVAERDDDVAATMGSMIASDLADGYMNLHDDEQVVHTFDEMTEHIDLVGRIWELWREWLIAGQVNTVTAFTNEQYEIRPEGVARVLTRNIATPNIGVLPAEQIRVINNNVLGEGRLAYAPEGKLREWLEAYFDKSISGARKSELRKQDPLAAALFTEEIEITEWNADLFNVGEKVYVLNPAMVQRTTMAKGAWQYPRPPLTRNFALLEAKRLLNIMDFALLQGGTNYIVIARKGSEKQPALPEEVANLREVVKRAGQSGVLVGDHRVSLEVVTPDLTELLNAEKRQLLGRKIAGALLRLPEFASDETGQSVQTVTAMMERVITMDRGRLVSHLHRNQWKQTMRRNRSTFGRGDHPRIWLPKIVLQGTQFFTDYILKLHDRGDIPRRWAVAAAGFDYDAAVATRQRELDAGHDEILLPPQVPFSSPQNGPQDNNTGRPPGSRDRAPGDTPERRRPQRTITRNPGETVRAWFDDDRNRVLRMGETTYALLEEYPEARVLRVGGRMSEVERNAAEATEPVQDGNLIVVPVNTAYEIVDTRMLELGDGIRIVLGRRKQDDAIMARALIFREPVHSLVDAQNMAVRWGYPIEIRDTLGEGDDDVVARVVAQVKDALMPHARELGRALAAGGGD